MAGRLVLARATVTFWYPVRDMAAAVSRLTRGRVAGLLFERFGPGATQEEFRCES